jgi:hypothetical protein
MTWCSAKKLGPPPDNSVFTAGSKAHMVDIQPGINRTWPGSVRAIRRNRFLGSTVSGDVIAYSQAYLREGAESEYGGPTTFASAHAGHYLRHLKDVGFFPDNPEKCKQRVEDAGFTNFFHQKVI